MIRGSLLTPAYGAAEQLQYSTYLTLLSPVHCRPDRSLGMITFISQLPPHVQFHRVGVGVPVMAPVHFAAVPPEAGV